MKIESEFFNDVSKYITYRDITYYISKEIHDRICVLNKSMIMYNTSPCSNCKHRFYDELLSHTTTCVENKIPNRKKRCSGYRKVLK